MPQQQYVHAFGNAARYAVLICSIWKPLSTRDPKHAAVGFERVELAHVGWIIVLEVRTRTDADLKDIPIDTRDDAPAHRPNRLRITQPADEVGVDAISVEGHGCLLLSALGTAAIGTCGVSGSSSASSSPGDGECREPPGEQVAAGAEILGGLRPPPRSEGPAH